MTSILSNYTGVMAVVPNPNACLGPKGEGNPDERRLQLVPLLPSVDARPVLVCAGEGGVTLRAGWGGCTPDFALENPPSLSVSSQPGRSASAMPTELWRHVLYRISWAAIYSKWQ